MPKITLNTIGSRYGSIDALNANFNAIEDAFENTLSRDGEGPNFLEATVDANNNRIINLPDPVTNTEPATKGWVEGRPNDAAQSAVEAAAAAAAAAVSEENAEIAASQVVGWLWLGEWQTGYEYEVNNIVAIPLGTYEGWTFIAVEDHTSGSNFETDFGSGKWEIVAKRGSTGAGTGDLLAVNNLSELTDVAAARTNLDVPSRTGGGASGTWDVDISGNAATATNATNATGTGTAVNTTATQTLTNKTLTSPVLTTPTINSALVPMVSGTAPLYLCRAWVNFNGTTTPPTIRASGNVSSVTRNATGSFTVNFTTAMPDVNYAGLLTSEIAIERAGARTTTGYSFNFESSGGSAFNPADAHVAIFR
jgi:hypothetical protein